MYRIVMTLTAAAALAAALPAATQAETASRIYVPLGSSGGALVLDTATDQPAAIIDGLTEAHGLAIAPDGRRLLAGSLMTDDAGAAPAKPEGMAEDEHNAHHGGGQSAAGEVSQLTLISLPDGSILRRIPVPGAVHHVAIAPDGVTAAASHPGGGGVSLVDLRNGAVIATVPTGPQPNYLAFSPDGKRLYVSNSGDGTISELALGHDVKARGIAVGGAPEHLVLSADGSRLYVNDVDGGAVVELDLKSRAVTRRFVIGGVLHGIDLSDDGSVLYVAALERNEIAAVDLATGDLRRATLSPDPYHLAVAPGTGKLYVSSAAESKLWAIDAKTLAVVAEIPIEGTGHQMAVTH